MADKAPGRHPTGGPSETGLHMQKGAILGAQTTRTRRRVTMVGPFPPPVHGMAAINAAVRDKFRAAGASPSVLNVSANTLARTWIGRLTRLPKIVRAVLILLLGTHESSDSLYISISAGLGQLYEVVFVLCARLRGLRLYLHHHSFAYLDRPSSLSWLLFRLAGRSAVHIALSRHMATRLNRLYRLERVLPISNSVFLPQPQSDRFHNRSGLHTLGFMSNLSVEKGIFEFLDLMLLVQSRGLPARASLAGPFDDRGTEEEVRARLSTMDIVDYVGPKYGEAKELFFSGIDVFVFPSQHRSEAEPIVIHEAMSRGIPVLAYGRGCISEIVSPDSGLVIDPAVPFAPMALAKIQEWVDSSASYERASRTARAEFSSSLAESTRLLRWLVEDILGATEVPPCAPLPREKSAS